MSYLFIGSSFFIPLDSLRFSFCLASATISSAISQIPSEGKNHPSLGICSNVCRRLTGCLRFSFCLASATISSAISQIPSEGKNHPSLGICSNVCRRLTGCLRFSFYFPVNFGIRFSKNAWTPSLWSCDFRISACPIFSCSSTVFNFSILTALKTFFV